MSKVKKALIIAVAAVAVIAVAVTVANVFSVRHLMLRL